jgi:hypothetical protein
MIVYLSRADDLVIIQAIAEAADGDMVGELTLEVRPGESAMGIPYAEWAEMPDGPVDVDPVIA